MKNIFKIRTRFSEDFYPYFVWFIASVFFAFQYMLRVIPNVMTKDLWSAFEMQADDFAYLGSLYFLSYSILQIPIGRLMDCLGVKVIILFSSICCVIGSIIFGMAPTVEVAQFARIVIGAGSASSLICALKVTTEYFPKGKRGMLVGITLSMGTVGALFSGKFLKVLILEMGWRNANYTTGFIGLLIFFLTLMFMQNDKKPYDQRKVVRGRDLFCIRSVFRNIAYDKRIIIYALLAVGLYSPLTVIADLWGTSFLKAKYHLSEYEALTMSLNLYLGLTIGSLVIPYVAEKYEILKELLLTCLLGILIAMVILVNAEAMSSVFLQILTSSIGFLCGAEMICFIAVLQNANQKNSGEISGIVNTFNMFGSGLMQQLVGSIIHFCSQNDNGNISIKSYELAMNSLNCVVFLCLLMLFFSKKLRI